MSIHQPASANHKDLFRPMPDELRAKGRKGAVNDALRNGLAEHKNALIEAYGDGIWPDETLPDEIVVPAQVPNEVQAIRVCIDSQRVRDAVA